MHFLYVNIVHKQHFIARDKTTTTTTTTFYIMMFVESFVKKAISLFNFDAQFIL